MEGQIEKTQKSGNRVVIEFLKSIGVWNTISEFLSVNKIIELQLVSQ